MRHIVGLNKTQRAATELAEDLTDVLRGHTRRQPITEGNPILVDEVGQEAPRMARTTSEKLLVTH